MNQPPGFDPPDDGYGGIGRKGATVPGGPPEELAASGGTQVGGSGLATTVIDEGVPAAAPTPAYPGAGPIGYAPQAPRRRANSEGSGLGVIFAMGLVVLLAGGGAAGAVVYVNGQSSEDEQDTAPILTFAPPSTIEAESEQASVPDDPPVDTDDLGATAGPVDPAPPPPPPPPAKRRKPRSPSTPAKPTATSKPTSTARVPRLPKLTPAPTVTSTWRPRFRVPRLSKKGAGNGSSTGTSTSTKKPPLLIPPGGFKIPKLK